MNGYDFNALSKEEFLEFQQKWLFDSFSKSELRNWFGIDWAHVEFYISQIRISERVFEELQDYYLETLKTSQKRKSIRNLFEKRLERLKQAYANSK